MSEDRDTSQCGPDGRHDPDRPGPDGVLRCACGVVSRHPAPTPKGDHDQP